MDMERHDGRFCLFAAGVAGFLAVAGSAYAEHGLKSSLRAVEYDMLQTALRYQLLHAVLLTVLGIALAVLPHLALTVAPRLKVWLRATAFFIAVGTVLFSGAIEGYVLFDVPLLLYLTPVGGFSLMLGWLTMAAAAIIL